MLLIKQLFDEKMKRLIIFIGIFLCAVSATFAETNNPQISVALARSENDQSSLEVKITNNGGKPFQFLDMQGHVVGDCSRFYTIILKTPQGDVQATGCWYADGEFPKLVMIGPGETHSKSIDPTAYRFPGIHRLRAPYEISVRYGVSGMTRFVEVVDGEQVVRMSTNKERYAALHKGLNVDFTFQTNFVAIIK